ncbi:MULTISPECIES: hypothetical protein [Halobacterium]|uniref:hypothetical protein n=1 Tax=Halobacterium TaxID=2239 RepID=UPI000AA4F839|nr:MULTISPECIES: hypothetical protein [Halobacterium]MCG1002856.1 hypothetical protein [Halobacterium noricense]
MPSLKQWIIIVAVTLFVTGSSLNPLAGILGGVIAYAAAVGYNGKGIWSALR